MPSAEAETASAADAGVTAAQPAAQAPGTPAGVAVWLAGPQARPLFNPVAQSTADLARWRALTSLRRKDEWEISRALLAQVTGATVASSTARTHEPAAERAERFYILWTLKESFTKALGEPLLATVRQCTFSCVGGEWRASVPTANAWCARVFRPQPQLMLSVVAMFRQSENAAIRSVFAHEWPGERSVAWPVLASLHCSPA